MDKISDLKRIAYHHYNKQELLDYYTYKALWILKTKNSNRDELIFCFEKIKELKQEIGVKNKHVK